MRRMHDTFVLFVSFVFLLFLRAFASSRLPCLLRGERRDGGGAQAA
jgi:hypothetical protein